MSSLQAPEATVSVGDVEIEDPVHWRVEASLEEPVATARVELRLSEATPALGVGEQLEIWFGWEGGEFRSVFHGRTLAPKRLETVEVLGVDSVAFLLRDAEIRRSWQAARPGDIARDICVAARVELNTETFAALQAQAPLARWVQPAANGLDSLARLFERCLPVGWRWYCWGELGQVWAGPPAAHPRRDIRIDLDDMELLAAELPDTPTGVGRAELLPVPGLGLGCRVVYDGEEGIVTRVRQSMWPAPMQVIEWILLPS